MASLLPDETEQSIISLTSLSLSSQDMVQTLGVKDSLSPPTTRKPTVTPSFSSRDTALLSRITLTSARLVFGQE